MQLYSTNNPGHVVGLEEAVMRGLPPDNGLYMPTVIPTLPASFIEELPRLSFQEVMLELSGRLIGDSIPASPLRKIVEAIDFPAPVVALDEQRYVLELFHGPSLAFKDFGARFMAGLMSYFNRNADRELVILVATSGDTGGAVAAGFHQVPGTRVVILYPSGKVSAYQEKQLTTLGHNITALEIEGTFDDCQALVKAAFLDKTLNSSLRLTSANSINIARLIPQIFYYFEGSKQIPSTKGDLVFCVPSGNFGNLTAGLIGAIMGLPVRHFLAATNINDVVPEYLRTGAYRPRPSIPTLSNAMDVGNPSNFVRMKELFGSTWNIQQGQVKGYSYSDHQTMEEIRRVWHARQYILDPHGAVGMLAAEAYLQEMKDAQVVVLETAHPAKFLPGMEEILGAPVPVPDSLARVIDRKKESVVLPKEYEVFRDWLVTNY